MGFIPARSHSTRDSRADRAAVTFDSNYVTLTMRYIVDPHQRRGAKSFLFGRMLAKIKERNDIQFGSTTSDVTVHGSLEEDLQMPSESKAA